LILEEGLPTETLWRVAQSMRQAAVSAQVQLVTGDTKVVDHGKGDGIFINTAGIGIIEHDCQINPANVQSGDLILLNGDIGRHGIAIMAEREGLEFETTIASDCAPLARPVLDMLDAGISIHCLRDLTRGGLATALVEIAESANLQIEIDEQSIPVGDDVLGACEILGLDPLYIANEGRFVSFVPAIDAERALTILRAHAIGADACCIGRASDEQTASVILKSRIGARRVVDMLSGEQLPRIC
jgi:hydrogenase expression/formation protein HypE